MVRSWCALSSWVGWVGARHSLERRALGSAGRWVVACVVVAAGASVHEASAAVAQQVQSGTAVNNANGIQTITISSVDTTKSFLIFETRSNSNRPVGSTVRGRLASATTIQFERVTDGVAPEPATINIQWYVATFGSGVKVQRGEVTQSATTVNVTITAVAAVNQAFVIWSKTPAAADATWNGDDQVLGELTTTSNLQFRADTATAAHIIAWQVVEFTNAADINVQKGSITTMTGTTTSVTATLSPAVNVNKTFVLVGWRSLGTGTDIGSRMLRAQLTNSTTITIDRSISGTPDDITEIVWQAIELKDASTVWSGSENFASGTAQKVVSLPPPQVNTTRAVAFISSQSGSGQNMGRTPYAGDDIIGVGSVTAALSSATQLTLDRNNTADTADVGWFVVQFDRGSGFKVGSFTKNTSAAPVTQTIAHGLGEVPKALILWTEGRSDQTFSSATGITFRAAAQAGTTTTTLTINKPTGTTQNDVMIASVAFRTNQPGLSTDVGITPPAGWTLVRRLDNPGPTDNGLAVYQLVAGASEPASYTWTFLCTATCSTNGFQSGVGGIVSFSGVDTTTPIDVENGVNTVAGAQTTPSVTTTMANTMLVTSHGTANGDTWTPPAGMTEQVDVLAANEAIEINTVLQVAAGATGTKTATDNGPAALDAGNAHILALRPAYPAYFGYGMSDGTTSRSISTSSQNDADTTNASTRMANKVLTIVKWGEVLLAEADLQSWDDTNFTLNWTTNDAGAYVIHYIAIAGTDVSAKVLDWTMATATGNQSITGVGFQPNVVIHAHGTHAFTAALPASIAGAGFGLGVMDADGDQWTLSYLTSDNSATSDTQRGQLTTASIYSFNNALAVQKQASWVSMNADGFTVNFSNATSAAAARVFSLALKGINIKAGSFNKTTTTPAPTSQAITGVGFQPSLLMLTSFQDGTQANPVAQSRHGIGASDGATQASSAYQALDAAAVADVDGIDKTSKVFMKVNNSTPAVDAEASLTSMDTDGFTLNWTTNDAVATEILYLALARLHVTEVRLLSFTGTRYDRGVLLAWRTGYEVDNLGFHVYREIGGVRTRVNSSIVAGSGLMVGGGTAVTGERNYAIWDLDAASADPSALYWLEDVDFSGKSTWHGPVTPVAGSLQVPPVVETSTSLQELARRARGHGNVRIRAGWDDDRRDARHQVGPQTGEPLQTQWELAAGAAVKIGINRPGWYRVAQPELVAAGLSPTVDPRRLQLFADGVEQAFRVIGEADGRLDAGDAIEFFATGVDTAYTDTRIYWLAPGQQPGRRLGMSSRPVRAASRGASFWYSLQQKERLIYFAALRNGDEENWFGQLIWQYEPSELTVGLSNVDHQNLSTPAEIELALQGVTIMPGDTPDHRVAVLVNGREIDEVSFNAQERLVFHLTLPSGVLRDGDNVVSLVARGGEADFSLVDYIRFSYWHSPRADADQLLFTADGQQQVNISGFSAPSIRVVDVTDPGSAIEVRGTVRAEGGLYAVAIITPGVGQRRLLAFTDLTIARPAFVRANRPSSWYQAANAFDYLLLARREFFDTLRPLVELRERQGYRAAIVDIEDVYDEFSFGEKTPAAMRQFLAGAVSEWQRKPRFAVFVGDATIDPRDYAGFGDFDLIPTKQVAMASVALETASDEWFADFDDDGLSELAVGRLPARSVDQVVAMVSKIVGYETQSAGSWMNDVTFVADESDSATDFEANSRSLASLLPANYRPHEVFRGVLGEGAHTELVAQVMAGRLIVNYQGHGSVRIWGQHGDLLSNHELSSAWRNGLRLPLVVAMNCLNGFFHGIYDEESLAEALLRAPDGGAVATWASSSLTAPATQLLVNQELFRLVFQGSALTLGEAVARAKQVVSQRDVRRSWIFFGDPAMRLRGMPGSATSEVVTTSISPSTGVQPDGRPSGESQPPAATTDSSATEDDVPFVRLVDYNADGRDDVFLYAAETGRWSILLSGNPRPANPSGYLPPHMDLFAGQLNGDRLADMFLRNADTGEWLPALNSGDGSLRLGVSAWAPRGRARLGDFNGDGRDDLFVVDRETNVGFQCLTDGMRGFDCRAGDSVPAGHLLVADFTGDGLADVFTYDVATGYWVLQLNKGTGTFGAVSGEWSPSWAVRAADLDGDRRQDVILVDPASGAWVEAFSAGAGEFNYRRGQGPATGDVHVLDVNGDGRDDLLRYDIQTGAWTIGLNVSPGEFTYSGGSWAPGLTIAWGDLNKDGQADLLLHDPATGRWGSLTSGRSSGVTVQAGTWSLEWSIEGRRP